MAFVSYWSHETCFVPEGTKLAARLARCLFVKTSRFNEKQYQTVFSIYFSVAFSIGFITAGFPKTKVCGGTSRFT